jgi:hypothetical protein
LKDVPYCTVSVRFEVVKTNSGTVTYCDVSWLSESGIVSYGNQLERIGTVTINSVVCDFLTVGSESRSDLLTAVGNFELILCFFTVQ